MSESSSTMSSITASSLRSVMPFIRIQTPSSVSSVFQGFDLSHSLTLSEFRTFSDFRQLSSASRLSVKRLSAVLIHSVISECLFIECDAVFVEFIQPF